MSGCGVSGVYSGPGGSLVVEKDLFKVEGGSEVLVKKSSGDSVFTALTPAFTSIATVPPSPKSALSEQLAVKRGITPSLSSESLSARRSPPIDFATTDWEEHLDRKSPKLEEKKEEKRASPPIDIPGVRRPTRAPTPAPSFETSTPTLESTSPGFLIDLPSLSPPESIEIRVSRTPAKTPPTEARTPSPRSPVVFEKDFSPLGITPPAFPEVDVTAPLPKLRPSPHSPREMRVGALAGAGIGGLFSGTPVVRGFHGLYHS